MGINNKNVYMFSKQILVRLWSNEKQSKAKQNAYMLYKSR